LKRLNKFLFVSLFALMLIGCSKKTTKKTTKDNKTSSNTTTQQKEETYTIKFVNSDDTLLEEVKVKKGDTPTFSKANPTKASDAYSYTFNGWNKEITAASSDTTYKATYTQTAIDFDINYELNGGINNANNPSKYNITMDDITLADPTKEGYSFNGWLSGTSTITTIQTNSAKNFDLEATWSINSYEVQIAKSMNDAGSVTGSGTYEYNSEVTLTATANTGYKFVGYYVGTELFNSDSEHTFNMPAQNLAITAVFEYDTYTVSVQNDNSNYGSISGDGTYAYKSNVTLTATPNEGYSFKGWYLNDALKSNSANYSFEMPNNDIELVAKWTVNRYEINVVNLIEGSNISGITSGNDYNYNTLLNLKISNIADRKWVKWSRNDGVEHVGTEYSFSVPARSLTITISYLDTEYYRDGNTVYFGYYPQTLENDSTIISNLNSKAGTLPTSDDSQAWTSYGYYESGNKSNYMWYIDIDLNEDGFADYRGVYMTKYRPNRYDQAATSGNSFIPGNGFTTETVYWFKYEVIAWTIIKTNDNKVTMIANLILDSQPYNAKDQTNPLTFEHNGGIGSANNYELSDIRAWLNDTFFNTAFSSAQKAIIKETTLDNSKSTTYNSQTPDDYLCDDTTDNVFLLSYIEAKTSSFNKNAGHTKYCEIQGFIPSINTWLLRSPYYNASDVSGVASGNIDRTAKVSVTGIGVRPAITIEL